MTHRWKLTKVLTTLICRTMNINDYFDSIKHNKVELQKFLSGMPKGGDLHNHLTGSVYAEMYFEIACANHLLADVNDGKLYDKNDPYIPEGVVELSADMVHLHDVRMTLIDKWSIRNFQPYKCALGPDEYFFQEFGLFSKAATQDKMPDMIHELMVRAKEEHVQYLEIMGIPPSINDRNMFLSEDEHNKAIATIVECCENYEEKAQELECCIKSIVDKYEVSAKIEGSPINQCVKDYVSANNNLLPVNGSNDFLTKRLDTCKVTNDDVTVRLQGYASRNAQDPIKVLVQLYIVHRAIMDKQNKYLVGCNIVAAENSEYSMQFYKAHMLMFKVLKETFPKVKTSIHAGELTVGLIRPEHLTHHIKDAVDIAVPLRIGHGADIAFEKENQSLIDSMKTKNMAIEINLTSNKFILGLENDAHPLTVYKKQRVPIVISTDDPGILRTSLTEEYTEAAYRYNLSYEDIRDIVRNSITYSFLSNDDKKGQLEKLNKAIEDFEKQYQESETVQEVYLPEIKKGMYMQFFVTAQSGDGHTIIIEDSSEKYVDKTTTHTGKRDFVQVDSGGKEVSGDNMKVIIKEKCYPIVTKSELTYCGKQKGVTYTITFEDQDNGDDDFNDICINITAWMHKD